MSEERKPPVERKLLIYAVVVSAVLLAAMFGWKELSLFRFERAIQVERESERAELAARESLMRDEAISRVSQMLELFSVPLAWSMRTEAIKEDYDQIEEYMLQLIKQPAVRGVAFVDDEGNVKLATDRKMQNESAEQLFGDLTAADETVLRTVDDELRLMVPVLGYNVRLGSLVVVFSSELLVGGMV